MNDTTTTRLYRSNAWEDGHPVTYVGPEYDTPIRSTYGPSDGIAARCARLAREAAGQPEPTTDLFPRRCPLGEDR